MIAPPFWELQAGVEPTRFKMQKVKHTAILLKYNANIGSTSSIMMRPSSSTWLLDFHDIWAGTNNIVLVVLRVCHLLVNGGTKAFTNEFRA
jgi:hypothetical protein